MKKFLVSILSILLLASCAPAESSETTPPAAAETDAAVTETEDPGVAALLPQADYNGASFDVMLEPENANKDFPQFEELTGEVLNDAIVDRNKRVEELYNIDLQYTNISEDSGPLQQYTMLAMTNDDTYKLYFSRVRYISEYIGEEVSRPWSDYPDIIDFEAPWFNTYAIETFSIGDRVDILVGDLNDSSMRETWAFLFSKSLTEKFNLPNLYNVVDDGKWTIDYLRTITQDIYVDTNGDGSKDEKDIYGFVTDQWVCCDMWCRTIGLGAVDKDENNMPVFRPLSEATINGYDQIFALMWESNGTYVQTTGAYHHTSEDGMFVQEKGVLSHTILISLETEHMREMDDFGILPVPKLTEDQDMGYTHTDCMFSSLLLPSVLTEEDALMSVTITNALNAFSHEIVIPAYYETVLKTKLTRDEDAPRMLDLIMEGRRYSLDMIAESNFPLTHDNMLRQRLGGKRAGISAMYAANEKRCQTWIENFIEVINSLDT